MRFLLDTHIWLWSLTTPTRIRPQILTQLADVDNSLLFSAASSWEIAIKYRLGKLPLPAPPAEFIPPRLVRDGIEPLPIKHEHAYAVADLPQHHNDPFDRLLIAQAAIEGLVLVTADRAMLAYEVELLML